jgi:hypothetical protein
MYRVNISRMEFHKCAVETCQVNILSGSHCNMHDEPVVFDAPRKIRKPRVAKRSPRLTDGRRHPVTIRKVVL